MKCICKEQPNENCLIVGNKFNPISHRPCVHFGTKLKVLIAYFKEKSNSLHLLINFYFSLKKPNKSYSLLSSSSIEYIFTSLRLDIQSLNIFFSEIR